MSAWVESGRNLTASVSAMGGKRTWLSLRAKLAKDQETAFDDIMTISARALALVDDLASSNLSAVAMSAISLRLNVLGKEVEQVCKLLFRTARSNCMEPKRSNE
jgi:hypothetical protein